MRTNVSLLRSKLKVAKLCGLWIFACFRVFFGIFLRDSDAWLVRSQLENQASKAPTIPTAYYIYPARWVSLTLCPILVSPLVDLPRQFTFALPVTYLRLLSHWLEDEVLHCWVGILR